MGSADDNPIELRKLGRELARSKNRPDGIITDSEMRSICLISGLNDEGVRVPEDMQFISKQTSAVLPAFFPAVDTVEEDIFSAGVELTKLLLRRIAGEPPAALQSLAEPKTNWKS